VVQVHNSKLNTFSIMQSSERMRHAFHRYYKIKLLQTNLRTWYRENFSYCFTYEDYESMITKLNKLDFKSVIVPSKKQYELLKQLSNKKYRSSEDKMIYILKKLGLTINKQMYDY